MFAPTLHECPRKSSASRQEKQAEMLKDPNVARAILQTLEGAGRPGASFGDPQALESRVKSGLFCSLFVMFRNPSQFHKTFKFPWGR